MNIPDFSNLRVLVVGDVILDEYVDCTADRLSPEAPVPVVVRQGEPRLYPGGAANVAMNVAGLGATVVLAGVTGGAGWRALEGIKHELIVDPRRPTTRKTRIIAHGHQMLRIDEEDTTPISGEVEQQLAYAIADLRQLADICIVSDYAKGVVTSRIWEACRSTGKLLFVGAKQAELSYLGATWLVANEAEMKRMEYDPPSPNTLVTRGERGMTLYDGQMTTHIPAVAREVYDVTGAGDTVLAVFACAVGSGMKPSAAAHLANAAAGIAVSKRGTYAVTRRDLESLQIPRADPWEAYKVVGFANGVFDMLHAGHRSLLERARKQCDYLIVGINSDASVKRLKGPDRPIHDAPRRAARLRELAYVDAVLIFEEDTPIEIIKKVRPDILFRGEEYLGDGGPAPTAGSEEVRSWGGRLVILPKLAGYSTTQKIAERMKK